MWSKNTEHFRKIRFNLNFIILHICNCIWSEDTLKRKLTRSKFNQKNVLNIRLTSLTIFGTFHRQILTHLSCLFLYFMCKWNDGKVFDFLSVCVFTGILVQGLLPHRIRVPPALSPRKFKTVPLGPHCTGTPSNLFIMKGRLSASGRLPFEWNVFLIPPSYEVWDKVMFSLISVILSIGVVYKGRRADGIWCRGWCREVSAWGFAPPWWLLPRAVRIQLECILVSHNSCFAQFSADRVSPSCPEVVVLWESIIGLSDETIHRANPSLTPDYPTIFIHKFIAYKCFITNAW